MEHHDRNVESTTGGAPLKLNTQGLFIREDIMAKTKQLAALISESEEVDHFKRAEKMIQTHPRIEELIRTIKKKQKEVVAFESMKNEKMIARIEGELTALQQELDDIPLVSDYQESQVEINDMLQMVISVIHDTVSEKINVESGKDSPPSSCND